MLFLARELVGLLIWYLLHSGWSLGFRLPIEIVLICWVIVVLIITNVIIVYLILLYCIVIITILFIVIYQVQIVIIIPLSIVTYTLDSNYLTFLAFIFIFIFRSVAFNLNRFFLIRLWLSPSRYVFLFHLAFKSHWATWINLFLTFQNTFKNGGSLSRLYDAFLWWFIFELMWVYHLFGWIMT